MELVGEKLALTQQPLSGDRWEYFILGAYGAGWKRAEARSVICVGPHVI